MGDVLAFTPRPKPAEADEPPRAMTEAEIRIRLGSALQTALDAADHIIAVLNHMDSDTDLEDGADAEPSLAAPENEESQVTWTRGTDQDREEVVAAEIVLPEIAVIPVLPWHGRGNVVTACGVALFDLVVGRA